LSGKAYPLITVVIFNFCLSAEIDYLIMLLCQQPFNNLRA
jgi:hypothetical protein